MAHWEAGQKVAYFQVVDQKMGRFEACLLKKIFF